MRAAVKKAALTDPAVIKTTIETCVERFRVPILVELGEAPIAVEPGKYSVDIGPRGCLLHVWSESGNLARRITAVLGESASRLELGISRFGRGDSTASLIDEASRGAAVLRGAQRSVFREFFRRMISRQYKRWTLERLSTSADLERSLSPIYSRAVLKLGTTRWAVIGVGDEQDAEAADQILTTGLIWLGILTRSDVGTVAGLKVFLPAGYSATTAQRVNYLTREYRFEVFEYDKHGNLLEIDTADHGNLQTKLEPCRISNAPSGLLGEWLRMILIDRRVDCIYGSDGAISLQARGIEFARIAGKRMIYGLDQRTPVSDRNFDRVVALAREILRMRSAPPPDNHNPLYTKYPERWLESQVRRAIDEIDARLIERPIYAHVPAVSGRERGVIDLLARDIDGRLAILELKASEDIHLPLQGLDYWMRAKWHLERGRFCEQGYFGNEHLSAKSPRLLFVAPALEFHPTTETILQFFAPEVPVERIGISEGWRHELRVEFRRKGARRLA